LKSKGKVSELSYEEQNHIQNIAIAHGVMLTYNQQKQFAKYRAEAAFSNSTDAQILYVVMTPSQRERFDAIRFG
jgi:hypothetical protein